MTSGARIELRRRWRMVVLTAQSGLCASCGRMIFDDPTVDHCIPLAMGGPDRLGNYVVMHEGCNNRKGNRQPTGCQLVFLLAVNNKLGVEPMRW